MENKTDMVNHPSHYTAGEVECIDALKAATEGLEGIEAVCTANAIKYLWRWKRKNGVEDLNKAIWYINRLKEEAEKKEKGEPLEHNGPSIDFGIGSDGPYSLNGTGTPYVLCHDGVTVSNNEN